MNKVLLGKYVNTHGLKGEIRIVSDFKYKSKAFKIGNKIIIDNKEYEINSYRTHKNYDMVTLKGIEYISSIPFCKNTLVYIDRDLYLTSSDYLDKDLIGFSVYNKNFSGILESIMEICNGKKVLKVDNHLIPSELIVKIDLKLKVIIIEDVEGL